MSKKRIVVGVSGGIAAYKACDLVSKLSKKDYEVKVILTKTRRKSLFQNSLLKRYAIIM